MEEEYARHACGKAGSLMQLEQVGDKIRKTVWGLILKDTEFQNEEAEFHGELLKIVEEWGDMTRDEFYINRSDTNSSYNGLEGVEIRGQLRYE